MPNYDARDLKLHVNPEALKPLFKIQPHKHAAALFLNWAFMISIIYLCIHYFNPVLYLATITLIGSRMHAIAILMHDASHHRFLKNRRLSDLITNVSTMYPLFSTVEIYRYNHSRHHRHLNTEEDPDWFAKIGKREFTFPKTKREFILTLLSYFLLVQGVRDAIWLAKRLGAPKEGQQITWQQKWSRLTFYAVLVAALTILGWWPHFLMYWVVPYLSTFLMFQYIRSVAEHFGELEYDHLLNATRTVKATLFEKLLFAPHHVSYHLEHHLYPGVPFYNLPKLHRLLMQDQAFKDRAHLTDGYLRGLMKELG